MNSDSEKLTAILKEGLQHQQNGNFPEALNAYNKVLESIPHQLDASYFKSIILLQQGVPDEVITLLTPVINQPAGDELDQAFARCHRVLGSAFQKKHELPKAIQHFEFALRLDPNELDYLADLIQALLANNQLDEAITFSQSLSPESKSHVRCQAALAEIAWKSWQVEDCLHHLQNAMRLAPGQLDLISQFLFSLNYLESDGPEIAEQHIALGAALERHYPVKVNSSTSDTTLHQSEKNLRIGFISPDLKQHSVAYFLIPLLEALKERSDVWVACYAFNTYLDSVSEQIKNNSDKFLHIPPPFESSQLSEDHLDLLFDLAGHTSGNALPILLTNEKPAPVVVNWLGYPNTTGFSYHDYRWVDSTTDPISDDHTIKTTSEQIFHLDPCFLCYQPPVDSPEVNELPAIKSDFITVGCFNNLNKINQKLISLWSAILHQSDQIRLLLKSPTFQSNVVVEELLSAFASHSIPKHRILIKHRSPDTYTHLETYHEVDFTLDTFPYNGTTTTFESLFMGSPVITLKGKTHRSRVSSSILSTLGQNQWIAESENAYIKKSLQLAADPTVLSRSRQNLREKLLESDLCNTKKFGSMFMDACRKCKNSVNSK